MEKNEREELYFKWLDANKEKYKEFPDLGMEVAFYAGMDSNRYLSIYCGDGKHAWGPDQGNGLSKIAWHHCIRCGYGESWHV